MAEAKKTREAIPSAYNIISSNRSIGYSLDAAIADIIDNSISAKATRIDLISLPGRAPTLSIVDNGVGMDADELADAMTFGGRINCQAMRDLQDLGRFGMGLKTASLSQCKRLEVVSKKHGKIVGGCWDLDYLEKNDNWAFLVLDEEECMEGIKETFLAEDEYTSGTVVTWKQFDRLKKSSDDRNSEFDILMDKAIEKLQLVFHRYLEGEEGITKIVIKYNGRELKPNDPFIKKKAPAISTMKNSNVNDSAVGILPHKLPHPDKLSREEIDALTLKTSLLETQGFYVYRNKRLIDYGTWFGMASKLEKTKLSRIQIDISNDQDSEWSLDIKKSHVSPPQKIRAELRNTLGNNEVKSASTFRPRKRGNGKDVKAYWLREQVPGKNAVYRYRIDAEHPLISDFVSNLPDEHAVSEFKDILKKLEKFFPFNLVEYDNQNDTKIENMERNVDAELIGEINLYKQWGFKDEQIVTFFPGMENEVEEYLRGSGGDDIEG